MSWIHFTFLLSWSHFSLGFLFINKCILNRTCTRQTELDNVCLRADFSVLWCDHLTHRCRQEEITRLASLQPQVELLETRLKELKEEKEGEEEPAFLDADISAFKEHYKKVLEDLRARERQLQLGETGRIDITLH